MNEIHKDFESWAQEFVESWAQEFVESWVQEFGRDTSELGHDEEWAGAHTSAAVRFMCEAWLASREDCAKFIETQRNDIPATGEEFANAIRARGQK